MGFSDRLKQLRIERNLSQKELGDYLGCSRSTIANYETGNRIPDIGILFSLANFFQVSIDFLVARRDVRDFNNVKLDNKKTFVFFSDPESGQILDCSKNVPEIYGYSKKEIFKMHIWDIIIGSKKDIMSIVELQTSQDYCSIITQHRLKDGTLKDVEVFRWFINLNNKKVIYSLVHDITDSNSLEDKIKKIAFPLITSLIDLGNNNIIFRENHSNKVARITEILAQKLGYNQSKTLNLKFIALLHDIGLYKVPRSIINKTAKLTEQELELVKIHVEAGYELLKSSKIDIHLLKIIKQHHERLDGSGYPNQLVGEDIIYEARILAIADVLEAMTSKRPYREAYPLHFIINYFKENKGKKFDQRITNICLDLLSAKNFQNLLFRKPKT